MNSEPHFGRSLRAELSDWQIWQTRVVVLAFAALSGLTVVAFTWLTEHALVLRQLERFGDDVWQHQEFARMGGQFATFAIVLTRWKGLAHQYELIRSIEADGCTIFNPHVVTIEDGGMKTIDTAQIEFKKRADPMGLMNPGKTRGWHPSMARAG